MKKKVCNKIEYIWTQLQCTYIVLMYFRSGLFTYFIFEAMQIQIKCTYFEIFRKPFYVLFLFVHLLPVQVNLTFTILPNPKFEFQIDILFYLHFHLNLIKYLIKQLNDLHNWQRPRRDSHVTMGLPSISVSFKEYFSYIHNNVGKWH